MKTILFQGDSITDASRTRENDTHMGVGYPTLIAAQLGYENPGKYRFLNRGVSGDRIVDLYARIKADIINLEPDYLSILIGINDVWHEVGWRNGVSAEKYYTIYNMMLDEIQEALPKTRILILEPFILKGSATEEKWEVMRPETEKRAEKARAAADSHHLVFVPLQERFDEAARKAPESYWLRDGVHPTAVGHELIKQAWLEGFQKIQNE